MRVLRVLVILVAAAFILLLIVGFDNILALLRSRVALFLALAPLVVLFLWSVYRLVAPPQDHSGERLRRPRRKP